MNLIKKFLVLAVVSVIAVLPLSAQAAPAPQVVLQVDLSVPNTITITATTNPSAATMTGFDVTGFYLDGFFRARVAPIDQVLVSGDLVSFADTSDGTPWLYRHNGSDPGLNVWTYTDTDFSNFTAGTQAFKGSGTWTVSPGAFADALQGSRTGNVYFPADDISDLPNAVIIGTYEVVAAFEPKPVPSLGTWSMILMALMLAFVGFRFLPRMARPS